MKQLNEFSHTIIFFGMWIEEDSTIPWMNINIHVPFAVLDAFLKYMYKLQKISTYFGKEE